MSKPFFQELFSITSSKTLKKADRLCRCAEPLYECSIVPVTAFGEPLMSGGAAAGGHRPPARNIRLKLLLASNFQKEDVMATEERETGTLIGSDKVEGTAVYGPDETKIGSIRARHDRQAVRQGLIRSFGLWRLPGNWRRSLPPAVGVAQV